MLSSVAKGSDIHVFINIFTGLKVHITAYDVIQHKSFVNDMCTWLNYMLDCFLGAIEVCKIMLFTL